MPRRQRSQRPSATASPFRPPRRSPQLVHRVHAHAAHPVVVPGEDARRRRRAAGPMQADVVAGGERAAAARAGQLDVRDGRATPRADAPGKSRARRALCACRIYDAVRARSSGDVTMRERVRGRAGATRRVADAVARRCARRLVSASASASKRGLSATSAIADRALASSWNSRTFRSSATASVPPVANGTGPRRRHARARTAPRRRRAAAEGPRHRLQRRGRPARPPPPRGAAHRAAVVGRGE